MARVATVGLLLVTIAGVAVTASPTVGARALKVSASPRPADPGSSDGYLLVSADGGVYAYGDATFYGSMAGQPLNAPVVGIAPTLGGYWLVASDGGVFAFGSATFDGSMGGQHLNAPIVGMAASPGGGYWLVAADGGVFAFGPAMFDGSMGGQHLNAPIVAMASSPGHGYWLVAADGGVFAFGDAPFYGSMGSQHLNAAVVSVAASPRGGYWLLAVDGGLFAFGAASFFGSLRPGGADPPVGIVASGSGAGYRIVSSDGSLEAFGDATSLGSAGALALAAPVVGVAQNNLIAFGSANDIVYADGSVWVATGSFQAETSASQSGPPEKVDYSSWLVKCEASGPMNHPADCSLFDNQANDTPFESVVYDPDNGNVYAGVSNGSLLECSTTNANSCQVLDTLPGGCSGMCTQGGGIFSLVYANGSVYAAATDGLYSCSSTTADSCTLLVGTSTESPSALSLDLSSTLLFVGLNGGKIWDCPLGPIPLECQTVDNAAPAAVWGLAFNSTGSIFYVGRSDGILWACTTYALNACQTLDNAGSQNAVDSLAIDPNGNLDAALSDPVLWQCSPTQTNSCQSFNNPVNFALNSLSGYSTLAVGGGYLYAGTEIDYATQSDAAGSQCVPGNLSSCVFFAP